MSIGMTRRSSRRARRAGAVAVVAIAGAAFSCTQVPVMRGDIEALTTIAKQAERNGALRCAPRELAMA